MESSVKYVDFSAIHLSGAETKLLREVCGKPQKRKTIVNSKISCCKNHEQLLE